MREITRRSQNSKLEVGLHRAESAELFDRSDRPFLAPDEKRGLGESPECLTNVDVEVTRKECSRRMTCAALVRRPVVDVDQIFGDNRVIDIDPLEPVPDASARDETIEHCGADYW